MNKYNKKKKLNNKLIISKFKKKIKKWKKNNLFLKKILKLTQIKFQDL